MVSNLNVSVFNRSRNATEFVRLISLRLLDISLAHAKSLVRTILGITFPFVNTFFVTQFRTNKILITCNDDKIIFCVVFV